MAEAVAFTLASKVLSKIASLAFTAAYKEGLAIWEAKDELSKLQVTVESIQAVLLDAEKKQQSWDAVRKWIQRLKNVLYDAADLFDEVATEEQIHNSISKKVLIPFFKSNPIISSYSIAKKVKAIRKTLVEITTDMAQFGFVICQNEVPTYGLRMGREPGSFVDAELVVGRENDKKVILEMLFNESNSVVSSPLVYAIVGIGGLGKTTLAQLIYNDKEVISHFDNQWFACISDISDEREVLGKIFQSMKEGNYSSLSVSQLQKKIRESVEGQRFLLVLDDVWDDHRANWIDRMSLLRSCAEGSRIIVTTRLQSVVGAVSASRDHILEGLSEENSWCLFKSIAFAPNCEIDPSLISLGKEILKRCRGVPLAIRSVGSLLSEKNTISEWHAIEKEGLGKRYHDETMSVIKLSYDHLPSNLKHCFAYCSLFPKDYKFMKRDLIHLWSAQGYVEPNNEETDFMHLLRRGFFQEAEKDVFGEVISCKMHDMMHDLALHVAGEESIAMSSTTSRNMGRYTRHVSMEGCEKEVALLKVERLHSFLLMRVTPVCNQTTLNKLFQNFKVLHTLSLKGLGIKWMLPSSIGELKLMRYLDLSSNEFEVLPESMINLVNLIALDLRHCSKLKVLPEKFQNLINLKYLNIARCYQLEKMPTRIGELTRLEYLSQFVVWKRSGLDALAGLQQQLRGELLIKFRGGIKDEDECNWKLPVCVQKLEIESYPGVRIPNWGNINGIETIYHLTHLKFESCVKVKCLPPLHCLPNLRWLYVDRLVELEFVESEEDYSTSSSSPFFPRLEKLRLGWLPLLKRWRKTSPTPMKTFPLLSRLSIWECPLIELESFPLCQRLQQLHLKDEEILLRNSSNSVTIQRQLPSTLFCPDVNFWCCRWLSSLQVEATSPLVKLEMYGCGTLKSLQLVSPHLRRVDISNCPKLVTLEAATPSLRTLAIQSCGDFEVNNLIIGAPLDALEELEIMSSSYFHFRELKLDWDSLSNLRKLKLRPMPNPNDIPLSLLNRQALGQLKIIY